MCWQLLRANIVDKQPVFEYCLKIMIPKTYLQFNTAHTIHTHNSVISKSEIEKRELNEIVAVARDIFFYLKLKKQNKTFTSSSLNSYHNHIHYRALLLLRKMMLQHCYYYRFSNRSVVCLNKDQKNTRNIRSSKQKPLFCNFLRIFNGKSFLSSMLVCLCVYFVHRIYVYDAF